MSMLLNHASDFTWDYRDMNDIDPMIFTHNIKIQEYSHPICQPQRWMNPALKDTVKKELNIGIEDQPWLASIGD